MYEDLNWAKADGESSELTEDDKLAVADFKKMDHVILINNCSLGESISLADNETSVLTSGCLFDSFEDELYSQAAEASVAFKIPYGKTPIFLSIIKCTKLLEIVKAVEKMCETPAV